MRQCRQIYRRGAVYYFRAAARWSDGATYRVALSLLTRRLAVARKRAIRLADFAETLRHSLERDPGRPPLTRAERNAHFRRLLHAERDRIEALHMAVVEQVPGSADQVTSVFDELERLSRALVCGGLPSDGAGSRLESASVNVTDRCLALWDAEVTAELRAQNLANTAALRRAMLKLIHEARVTAIAEFRACLADPAAGYAHGASDGAAGDSGGADRAVPSSLATDGGNAARSRAPTGWGWPGRHEGRTSLLHSARATDRGGDKWAGVTVTEAAQRYIASVPRAGGSGSARLKRARKAWDEKTRRQFESAAMLLGKAFPGPIAKLQQVDLDRFAGLLDRLPAHRHHKCARHRTMSLEAIADEAAELVRAGKLPEDQIGLMPPSTNRHFRFLRALCSWVRKRTDMAELNWDNYIFADDRDSRDQRMAFTPEQGRALFALPLWTGCESALRRDKPGPHVFDDAAYWVPLLCWYTGARREEMAKLMTEDVQLEEDIHYLSISVTPSGRIKNARSKRLIPVGRELLRLGFLDYVKAIRREGHAVLFPDLLPGTSRQRMGDVYYKRYWRSIATHLPFLEPGQALHAFRHMVSTELKNAEVFVEKRNDLLGHASRNPMAERYSKATRLRKLAPMVNRIPIVTAHLSLRPVQLCTRYWPQTLPQQGCERSRADAARPREPALARGKSVSRRDHTSARSSRHRTRRTASQSGVR